MIKTNIYIAITNENKRPNEELLGIISKVFINYEKIVTRSKDIPIGCLKPLRCYTLTILGSPKADELLRFKQALGVDQLTIEQEVVHIDEV